MERGTPAPPLFDQRLLWLSGRPFQQLLSSCFVLWRIITRYLHTIIRHMLCPIVDPSLTSGRALTRLKGLSWFKARLHRLYSRLILYCVATGFGYLQDTGTSLRNLALNSQLSLFLLFSTARRQSQMSTSRNRCTFVALSVHLCLQYSERDAQRFLCDRWDLMLYACITRLCRMRHISYNTIWSGIPAYVTPHSAVTYVSWPLY